MIEAKLLLELLMRLFADPSGLDRGGELFEAHIGRQIRHIVFLLACGPTFADEPDFLSRHALHTIVAHAMLMAVRDANTMRREERCESAFRAPASTDLLPFCVSQSRLSGDGRLFGDVVFAGARKQRCC